MAIESIPVPAIERLAAKMGRDVHTSANDFATLDRDIDFRSALISCHRIEFGFESFVQELGDQITGARRSGGAAFRWLARFDDIRESLKWTISAEVKHRWGFFLAADEKKFPHVVFDFTAANNLIEIQAVDGHQ